MRIAKFETRTKAPNPKFETGQNQAPRFVLWDLGFVSDFGFRISGRRLAEVA